ncbi:MAG: DUF560 domain-containing protein [Boseongicola sp. SB0662_bin_57]|nr:DUF560 domain-containing protein [Boseongicola sp. SB0662_bin_57]
MKGIRMRTGLNFASLLLGAVLTGLLFIPAGSADGQDSAAVMQAATDSADAQIGKAAALLGDGQWEAAFAILRPVAARDPRAGTLLFETGMATLGAAHRPGIGEAERDALLDVSIAAFRALLAANPDLTRARLELGRAFFLKGQDGLARRQFERVLAGDVPAPVVANVNRFLAEIRARRRWSAHGGIGLAPDTNIGAAPAQEAQLVDTPFGRLPFTPDEKPTSGVGVLLWGGWEYQQPLGERTRLRFGGNVSRREYAGSRFDRMTLGAQAGPRWLIAPGTEASLLALASRHWQGSSVSHDELGFRIEGRHSRGRRTLLNFNGSWRERSWNDQPDWDGPIVNLGFGARYQATPALFLNASVFGERDRSDLASRRNKSYGLSIGASRDLSRGFTVGLDASLSRARYDEIGFSTTDRGRREDRTTGLSVNLTKRDLTIGGFSPRLTLGHSARRSNAVFQDYERSYGEISFVRQF